MSALLFLLVVGMWIVMRKRRRMKKWFVVAPMTALGACSFASTGWGATAAGWLTSIVSVPAKWCDAKPPAAAAVFMFLAMAIAIYDIAVDKKANKPALVSLAILPLLFSIAAGPVASGGRTFTDAIAEFGSGGFGYLVTG